MEEEEVSKSAVHFKWKFMDSMRLALVMFGSRRCVLLYHIWKKLATDIETSMVLLSEASDKVEGGKNLYPVSA